MDERIVRYVAPIVTFCCGFIVCANLAHLLDVGEWYEPAWWKVGFAILLSIFFNIRVSS